MKDQEYDWIDDAFDDSKQDPLAAKGMTGGSSLSALLAVIAVIVIVVAAIGAFTLLFSLGASNALG